MKSDRVAGRKDPRAPERFLLDRLGIRKETPPAFFFGKVRNDDGVEFTLEHPLSKRVLARHGVNTGAGRNRQFYFIGPRHDPMDIARLDAIFVAEYSAHPQPAGIERTGNPDPLAL